MTVHPKTIPYSEWIALKKYIYRLLSTGYNYDEMYRKDILLAMRDIEKQQVEKENGVVQNV